MAHYFEETVDIPQRSINHIVDYLKDKNKYCAQEKCSTSGPQTRERMQVKGQSLPGQYLE